MWAATPVAPPGEDEIQAGGRVMLCTGDVSARRRLKIEPQYGRRMFDAVYPHSLAILPLHSRLAPQFVGCIVSAAVLHPLRMDNDTQTKGGNREEIVYVYAGDGTPVFSCLDTSVAMAYRSSWGSWQNATF